MARIEPFSRILSSVKEKKCLPLLFEEDILGLRGNFCFVLHGWLILIDREHWQIYFDDVFHYLSRGLCDTSMFLFLWMSQWNDFCLHILTNRFFCFFIKIHHVFCVFIVSWIGKIDYLYIVHISISFLNWITTIEWIYWETHFILIAFFKSTNSFKRQLSSRRNNLKLLSNESTLWTIFWIIENGLAFIYRWSLDTVDLQRPDWICRSTFTTYHLISGKEISCLFTILRGNIFCKPLPPFGWSLWRFEVHLMTVLESEGMKFIEATI